MSALAVARSIGPQLTHIDELIWVGDIPALGAQRCPDRTAIWFADRNQQLSYAQLDRHSDAFAALLRSYSLPHGACIAYLGRNSDLFLPVLFGAIRAGVMVAPLNWRLTASELAYQLADSNARLLLCDPDLAATAARACEGAKAPIVILPTEAVGQGEHLRQLLLRPAPATAVPHDAEAVVLLMYTSGTTGKPKGVMLGHRALSLARHGELTAPELAHFHRDSTALSAMPNSHIGGISWVLMGLIRQCTVVLTADPSAANLLRLTREYRVHHNFVVPTVIRAIVDELQGGSVGEPLVLRGLYYGAMPMSEQLLRAAMPLLDCPFLQFFGMTEVSGAATLLPPGDHDLARPSLLKSVGKPYPGMIFEIRGLDRRVLQAGEHGEVWIKTPTLMLGYLNQAEKTREAVIEGWYATGDGGYIDAEGYLFLTDRIKDMIVSGGENVYPAEVEEALRRHPAVLDAAVVGAADDRWGERVVALVQLRSGASATEAELQGVVREHIAAFKCPKTIRFTAQLPRTAAGKVQRALVRNQF